MQILTVNYFKNFQFCCEKMVVLKLTLLKLTAISICADFNLRTQINKPIQLIVSSQKNQVTQVQQMQKCILQCAESTIYLKRMYVLVHNVAKNCVKQPFNLTVEFLEF